MTKLLTSGFLGLTAFALYKGQNFQWALFAATRANASKVVTEELHTEFHRRLVESQHTAKEDTEESMMGLIRQMTAFESPDRISPIEALTFAQGVILEHGRGTITTKAPPKRKLKD